MRVKGDHSRRRQGELHLSSNILPPSPQMGRHVHIMDKNLFPMRLGASESSSTLRVDSTVIYPNVPVCISIYSPAASRSNRPVVIAGGTKCPSDSFDPSPVAPSDFRLAKMMH